MIFDLLGGMGGYTLEEAVSLINLHVVRKKQLVEGKTADLNALGYICGVIHVNEEVEILAKFPDILIQLPKDKVEELLEILPDDDI